MRARVRAGAFAQIGTADVFRVQDGRGDGHLELSIVPAIRLKIRFIVVLRARHGALHCVTMRTASPHGIARNESGRYQTVR